MNCLLLSLFIIVPTKVEVKCFHKTLQSASTFAKIWNRYAGVKWPRTNSMNFR